MQTIAAQAVLLANPEPLGEHNARWLVSTLTTHPMCTAARRLAVGVSEQLERTDNVGWEGAVRSSTLGQLLTFFPNIRELTIIHCDIRSIDCDYRAPSTLSQLTSLVEVTFALATPSCAPSADRALLAALPSSVRYINLPTSNFTWYATPAPPSFRLSGLLIPEYPSTLASWLLTNSAETLVRLTVRVLHDPPLLHQKHPNLRYLNVLEAPSLNIRPEDERLLDHTPPQFPVRIFTNLFKANYRLRTGFVNEYYPSETERALCAACFDGHNEWINTIYPRLRFEEYQQMAERNKRGGFSGWLQRRLEGTQTIGVKHVVIRG